MKSGFEQKKNIEKIKEVSTLLIFILLSLILSVIIIDFTVFPLTNFSVNDKTGFTSLYISFLIAITLIFSVFYIVKSVNFYRKNGFSLLKSISMFLCDRLVFIAISFVIFLSASILIFIIYFVLDKNYYFLYEMIN